MKIVAKLLLCVCFEFVKCVPPSPTSIVTDTIKAEFSTMKNTMKILSEQWEKWNTLFITSLEPRITSTASTLASIDTNIHNLQERAHIWDTFQLHVSAWNEQLASLDRKMDIISKGQEKMLTLDDKINTFINLEYKLDNNLKVLNSIQDSINSLDTNIQTKKSHDSLFSEFATRGVLSSIKMVEKKLDRLLLANQNTILTKTTDEKPKPKFTIKCNIPRVLEELLNDISSKVDVIFDNTVTLEEDDNDYESDYINVGEGSGDLTNKPQSLNKRSRKAAKRAIRSCRQTNQVLEELLNRSLRIENMTLVILDKGNTHFNILNRNKVDETFQRKIIKHISAHYAKAENNISSLLESFFSEQKVNFENILDTKTKICCTTINKQNAQPTTTIRYTPSQNFIPIDAPEIFTNDIFEETTASSILFDFGSDIFNDTTISSTNSIEEDAPTWKPIVNQNKSSCEDLENDDGSGVYIFENNLEGKGTELFFNKRYCQVRENSFWTVIQRRDNYTFQHNFNVTWEDYKYGFGNLHRDFWIGNDFLYAYSNSHKLILRIELQDFENNMVWAEYDTFIVDSENNNYKLRVGGFKGNVTDSFSSHNGSYFSTYDKINDDAPECCPCSVSYGSGWWFNKCFESNLNGVYFKSPHDNTYFRGIIWEHWLGNYSLKKTVMMVKSTGIFNSIIATTETIPFYEDP